MFLQKDYREEKGSSRVDAINIIKPVLKLEEPLNFLAFFQIFSDVFGAYKGNL